MIMTLFGITKSENTNIAKINALAAKTNKYSTKSCNNYFM